MRLIGLSQILVKSFFDEADVTAAFHARDSDIGKGVRGILSLEKALSRGYADSPRLARETFAWHKTTLTRFSN